MPTSEETTITLPIETLKLIRAKVASGVYESEADVIDRALDALEPHEQAFERWLHEEVIPAAEELDRNPASGLTVEQVKQSLAEALTRFQKAG